MLRSPDDAEKKDHIGVNNARPISERSAQRLLYDEMIG
jgi:hypothetical protein